MSLCVRVCVCVCMRLCVCLYACVCVWLLKIMSWCRCVSVCVYCIWMFYIILKCICCICHFIITCTKPDCAPICIQCCADLTLMPTAVDDIDDEKEFGGRKL
jgi:hypothetical protein